MKRFKRIALIGCLLFGLRGQVHGEVFPQPSCAEMCEQAELIVEGKWIEGEQVAVAYIWKSPASLPKDTKELKVIGLANLTRIPMLPGNSSNKAITTKDVVLFLNYDQQRQAWTPLYTLGGGSPGVFWLDRTTCYGYVQLTNPGGYSLVEGGTQKQELVRDLAPNSQALRKSIEVGLAAANRFREDMAISDPGKRAQALVRYLLPRTTPDQSGAHLLPAEKAVRELGKDAVPAIVAAIRTAQPKEEIHYLLTPLWGMGPNAKAAMPVLLEVLARKDRNAGSAIVAMETIGDPAGAPHIRPFLRSADHTERYVAARALSKLGDKESFDAIARLIPSPITANSIYEVKDVLNWLYALDAVKTRPLAAKASAEPAMAPVRDQIEALRNRP